ncbi:hypothetical protein KUW17_10860 [Leisingera aquaemixtae]|uniref:hypothetical protein n=1 Tax=Leisingera aquaemixtae TaxID=1396826 RepID=UPI001C95C74A|nr:hypothetical protein [Leisingera aquaemixtae]MBY6067242.1 hypothetical protein [Leisingera aquaemixtae]
MTKQEASPFGFHGNERPLAPAKLALLAAIAAIGSTANGEEYIEPEMPGVQVANAFEEGARAMMCEKVGFLSFVWAIDQELKSPQFPDASVQYSDSLIAVTRDRSINGISVPQSEFLWREAPRKWKYSGFDGIEPVTDSCTDITAEIAASFMDFAEAASWGLPDLEQRAVLFDALEDDLRTRLELAQIERDEAKQELVALRDENSGLETELSLARLAVCEISSRTQEMLVNASAVSAPAGLAEFSHNAARLFGGEDCNGTIEENIEEKIENAVFVSTRMAPPK